jgi:alpha-L-fucosidase
VFKAALLAACGCAVRAPTALPPPAAIAPTPSARQLAWQELELCAFVHFGMNTFTGREWGEGTEDPAIFAPESLDCRQWARVFKEAGMKGVILTAKHHDGFCLWPSQHSPHIVAQSAWRNGKGDVVRELSEACREAGLKLGVYLSPWDRAHPDYGDSPRYNAAYRGQLEELLTSYGPIFEVWWDGACGEGPNGRKQVYDFDGWTALVRKLQPDAVIFSDVGPDVRWVGNEDGSAGETCWGMISPAGYGRGAGGPPQEMLNRGLEDGTDWLPAECDVSIRPGWFWHAEEDAKVKSLVELDAIWHASVGRGASLLLNVPANRSGRISDGDAQRLVEFHRYLDAIYSVDLTRGARATASNVRGEAASLHGSGGRFAPGNVLDADPLTCWATDDGVAEASMELKLPASRRIDRILLQEPIALGQRVRSFTVEARVDGGWKEIAQGTTIGRKRILRFAPLETSAVRIHIRSARACPMLSRVGLFRGT